jgi:hypothetical protein
MNRFNEFNIKFTSRAFEGDKIKVSRILNKEITVHDYKIEDSKVFKDRGTGKCLYLQISLNNEKHVVFTGASALIEMIQQVPKEGFPFLSTIVQENERYKFS